MGRIKVLHVIGGGEFGGAEQHLLTLLKHTDCSQIELHVACLFSEPLAPLVKSEGFPVVIFRMKSKIDWKPISDMASLIKLEGFHIVHTHGVRANLIGRLAAKRAGVGHVVTTVHSVLAFDYNGLINRWINKMCEKITRGITERFIVVCEMLARQLKTEGISEEKIVTIHNGLEIEKYDPAVSGAYIRQEFGIDSENILIGIIARLHPVKGHKFLLEATAKVIRKIPNLLLIMVGTGPLKLELQETANRLGIASNIIFAGFRKDIPEIIASLDFLVLPSLSEGLSLTVMEGMAMKKAVLATRVGGTPEVITSGVDGLLVPPRDVAALAEGIENLAFNGKMAVEFGEMARKTIEGNFTAGLMADKTAMLYVEILEGGKL